MTENDYWQEAFESAFGELGVFHLIETMTREQRSKIGESLAGAHENHGMAFYSPPASERFKQIEREGETKLAALQREFDAYRRNAEQAVKKALGQYDDAIVSIGRDGEVLRHGGRTDMIQR